MSGNSNQKLKTLCLMKILLEQTDENHSLTATELINALESYNITAARKSIYDDIESLQQFGLDIMSKPSRLGGYYIASRDFELVELKLLVDAVQSSRLITDKKSGELIRKLSKLASDHEAKQLDRQVYVSGRPKTENESAYYNVDAIHTAITDSRKISFKYFDYSIRKKPVYRKNGESYVRTPLALCWNEDNYYLITYSPKHDDKFAAFRVDRMSGVEVLKDFADKPEKGTFNIVNYAKKTFGMYSGVTVNAKLTFDSSLVSVVLDHFGSGTKLAKYGENGFTVEAEVSASPTFLGWMFQFGSKAEILSPQSLRDAMRDLLATNSQKYAMPED